MPQAVVSPECDERGTVSRLFDAPKPSHPKAAARVEANEAVVCNKCTKYKENSRPDIGRTLMSLGSAHFRHAEKAAEYFLTVLGALS